jgi:very-short-patch-repair endonuclease
MKYPEGVLTTETARIEYVAKRAESVIECKLGHSLLQSWNFVVVPHEHAEHPLERHEIAFVMQYPVGRYRLDMALFFRASCGRLFKIAVECDGKQFHEGEANVKRDSERDAYLRGEGFEVWRYSGWLLNYGTGVAADEVQRACEALRDGREPVLTFSRGRQNKEPTLREYEQALLRFWDGIPWPPRMGPNPKQRGWHCMQDFTDWAEDIGLISYDDDY